VKYCTLPYYNAGVVAVNFKSRWTGSRFWTEATYLHDLLDDNRAHLDQAAVEDLDAAVRRPDVPESWQPTPTASG
jgi:hypothetical protein